MRSVENEEYGKWRVWKIWSVENEEYGKCGVWKMWSMENAECGKCGVWKMRSIACGNALTFLLVGWKTRSAKCGVRSVENEKYGKWGSEDDAEYGKLGVWKIRSMENAECVEMHKR